MSPPGMGGTCDAVSTFQKYRANENKDEQTNIVIEVINGTSGILHQHARSRPIGALVKVPMPCSWDMMEIRCGRELFVELSMLRRCSKLQIFRRGDERFCLVVEKKLDTELLTSLPRP